MNKSIISTLSVLIVFASMTQAAQSWEAPSFCGGIECPEFKRLTPEGEFELREYSKSRWVSTAMNGDNRSGFMTLFGYISGKNERNEKMAMTAPVIKKISAKIPFTEKEMNMEMSFYMNSKYQNDDAPKPTDKDTYLSEMKKTKFAVITYSGYSNQEKEQENLKRLGSYLLKNDIKFKSDYYVTAGYDSPMHFFNRHNEVWVELK